MFKLSKESLNAFYEKLMNYLRDVAIITWQKSQKHLIVIPRYTR